MVPDRGRFVHSAFQASQLQIYSVADGTLLAAVAGAWGSRGRSCSRPCHPPTPTPPLAGKYSFLTSDPLTGVIFGGDIGSRPGVRAIGWSPDGSAIEPEAEIVADAGVARETRPMAVMPPSPGKRHAHLVIGVLAKSSLRVLELPSRRCVFATELPDGVKVLGLAADHAGTALVVCDFAAKATLTLPWPLYGMPTLE